MRRDDFDNWRMRLDQLDEYVESVRRAQKDSAGLIVRLALEVDYLPGQEEWIRDLAARHPWDYLIGSVHYVSDAWAVDNPEAIAKWKGRDPYEVWAAYFDRLTQAADPGLFDIIGHADLPKKFNIYPKQDCAPLFNRFLERRKRRISPLNSTPPGCAKSAARFIPAAPSATGRAKEDSDHVWFRRPCAVRSGSDCRAVNCPRARSATPIRAVSPNAARTQFAPVNSRFEISHFSV